MTVPAGARTLWLSQSPLEVEGGDVLVVLDPCWTPVGKPSAPTVLPVRDLLATTLHAFDPIAETSAALDAWARSAQVVEAMTIGGTSIWYYRRLHHWQWLQERILWAHVVRQLFDDHRPGTVVCGPGTSEALLDVARVMAHSSGVSLRWDGDTTADADDEAGERPTPEGRSDPAPPAVGTTATPIVEDATAADGRSGWVAHGTSAAVSLARRLARRFRRLVRRSRKGPAERAAELKAAKLRTAELTSSLIEDRLTSLAEEPGRRLLVVMTHHAQRIETAGGARMTNPYLGTVAERLAGTTLDPILLDWRLKGLDAGTYARLTEPGAERLLPLNALRPRDELADPDAAAADAEACARISAAPVAVVASGIDLGPALAAHVADDAARWLPSKRGAIARLGELIRRLHPAGILLADEYHRQDWMEAAREAGLPVAAIQHGTIYRHHRGYIHAERPPQLALPTRTYVYGRWERDLLVNDSVYRDDEVVVGGSPRLDLDRPGVADRDAVRAELGVADGDRLLVLSGTYGGIYRSFHYPVALARVFDRPLPGIHLVVKQHPAEEDEGPYRAVIESVAAAGGFAPPPISIVRDVDLYRLLRAADGHLGIHSTVLTEAVFTGTPNLLATSVMGGDLLDYVASGVALPVASGGDLLEALDAVAAGALDERSRAAFLAVHYEPGSAATRIADDLLALMDA